MISWQTSTATLCLLSTSELKDLLKVNGSIFMVKMHSCSLANLVKLSSNVCMTLF